MRFCDTHVHSHLSVDSIASIEAMCEGAIANGIPCLTFADHLDMNPNDDGYGFYRPEQFFEEVRAAKRKFAGRLKVRQGIEFGEPHLYPDTLAVLHKRPYDVIIGSIHWVDDDFPGSHVAQSNPRTYFERYYTVMLAMVQSGGFDILGHFDFPKRYLGVNVADLPIIDAVVEALATSGIALEINTSSLRKGLPDTMPSIEILEKYTHFGGTKITLSSDAHTPDDIGASFDDVWQRLAAFPQLELGYFENRRFIRTI
jgi:histidinol-phosphatase (PHP family)